MEIPPLIFTAEDANRAYDEWGCNCGPSALAAIAGFSLNEIRPIMGDFEQKGYTNPKLMFECLRRLGHLSWRLRTPPRWPQFGLVRIQWEGPWTKPGVPLRARYRHTHWVAAARRNGSIGVFDVNCMNSGGWVALNDWSSLIVPHILQCVPKSDGGWHLTHSIEVNHHGSSSNPASNEAEKEEVGEVA